MQSFFVHKLQGSTVIGLRSIRDMVERHRRRVLNAGERIRRAAHLYKIERFYRRADRAPQRQALTQSFVRRYADDIAHHPMRDQVSQTAMRSMLHDETLLLLYFFARRARVVLEIGPYTGGSTIAMAHGLKGCGGRLVAIEPGGAHYHPHFPSTDILRDLKEHIDRAGVRDTVQVVEGRSSEPAVKERVFSLLAPASAGLLAIDADGNVARDFECYRSLLAPDCVIVLDDYSGTETVKIDPVRAWVKDATAAGIVRELGVFRWGTWFGQLLPRN